MKPLITTIIPTFRRPTLLKRAIQSVLEQTYPFFQVCIYDNASNDETKELVAKLMAADDRIKYFEHKENIGAFANFCFGLSRVTTEYFSFLSDDDFLLPEFYSRTILHFSEHKEIGFVATSVLNRTVLGDYVIEKAMRNCQQGTYTNPAGYLTMIENGAPTWTGIVFRRSVRDRIGLMREDLGAPSDYAYVLKSAQEFGFYYDPTPSVVFEPASLLGGDTIRSKLFLYWPAWANMMSYLSNYGSISPQDQFRVTSILMRNAERKMIALSIVAFINRDRESICHSRHVIESYFPRLIGTWSAYNYVFKFFPILPPLIIKLNTVRRFANAIIYRVLARTVKI